MGNEASRPGQPGAPHQQPGAQQQQPGGPAAAAAASPPKLPTQYNMRVVVRGARKTGKSALLARLQGRGIPPDYAPTPEIKTASFKWTYKNTDDRIMIEVLDVVDTAVVDDDAPAGACAARAPRRARRIVACAPSRRAHSQARGVRR